MSHCSFSYITRCLCMRCETGLSKGKSIYSLWLHVKVTPAFFQCGCVRCGMFWLATSTFYLCLLEEARIVVVVRTQLAVREGACKVFQTSLLPTLDIRKYAGEVFESLGPDDGSEYHTILECALLCNRHKVITNIGSHS